MGFSYNKLRGRIIEKYGSVRAFVRKFGISNNAFSKKLNNRSRFSTDDIMRMCEMLDIEEKDIGAYFFTQKV